MQHSKIVLTSFFLLLILAISASAQVENLSVIAREGDAAAKGGKIIYVGQASINNKGAISFLGVIEINGVLFLKNGDGSLTQIAMDRASTPIGGAFATITYPKINDLGQIVFNSLINNAATTGGIFLATPDGKIDKVVLDGDATPLGGTFAPTLSRNPIFSINNRGDIIFFGVINGGSSAQAIFLASNGEIVKVAAEGDSAPGGGALLFNGESIPELNNNGEVLFAAATQAAPNVANIYFYANGQLQRVVAAGDSAPGGGVFDTLQTKGKFLNDNRLFAFQAKVAGVTGVYLKSIDDGSIIKVAAEGDSAPDGGTIKDLTLALSPANGGLNNRGSLAFRILTDKTFEGLFIYINGVIRKVVGPGDPSPLGGTFSQDATFNSAYLGTIIADNDNLVFEATNNGGQSEKAIVQWSPQARSAPMISSASYKNNRLMVNANGVDSLTQVEINGTLINKKILLPSATELIVKGGRKKLNLNAGKGTNQVVLIEQGLPSAPFTF